MKYFLFLEIKDRDVNFLINNMIETISGIRPLLNAHLTVRGPYKNKIQNNQLEKFRLVMKDEILKISTPGRFSNPHEEVAYLSVQSQRLQKIWWKPDYPMKDHGFQPHISIYRGKDAKLADLIVEFLKTEAININFGEFELIPYAPKRHELYSLESNKPAIVDRFEASGSIKSDFLERFSNAIDGYKRSRTIEIRSEKD